MQTSSFNNGESPDKGTRSPCLIVDFGRAVFGFPRIQLEAPGGAVVEMTYGPVLVGDRVPTMTSGVRYGDRYVTRAGKQTWQVHEYKQFRYLEVVVRNSETPVSIDSVSLVSYNYPAERKGSFECSDATLTKLWKACVDTSYLHMEDTVICDALRERLCWTGDGGHAIYGIFAAYGDIAVTDRYLRLIARSELADGMLRMYYPGTEPGVGERAEQMLAQASENPTNIPQFALFYAIFVGEHYQYFGKRQLIEEIYPTLVRLAGWCKRHTNEAGLLCNLPNWNFTDWVGTDMRGANLETNALYYQALVTISVMARDLGRTEEADQWKREAQRVRASIRNLHWNAQKGLYVDSVSEGKQSATITEVSNGMSMFWGIASEDQIPKIVSGMADPHANIVRASPLYFYYALEGLVKAGASKVALGQMRDRYSRMLEASDAPTIWEGWGGTASQFGTLSAAALLGSLVHSGGVGPCWTLSKHVLGVYPVGPGFQKCRVEPATEGLEWARGAFPSVRGNVKVEWKKQGERLMLDVALPPALEAELALPRATSENLELVHNGRKHEIRAGAKSAADLLISEKRVAVKVIGGDHHLELGLK
jgi:hypothetical protein